ncbi:hypothetical protein Lfu02_02860 [Longispora fulva]|uniref:PucR C-terminal helix-turn-helix domain-containing protein n=1 Tax=Longispora fulva TaxID=619741 RepID=A0A8J7KVX3_9ACTN|nr:PucR family transcriptional regulator [Longispora fulva]MBG6135842.1 hypothetical protein [Longispora fulva]GIG55914.1 hypothetical protein Lfu02_02860 [Longispora fulva]
MEALALRLSQLDSHAEGAIRVIMFYDTLIRRRVDLAALVRASAGLAECVVGARLHGTGQLVRMSPDGTPVPDALESGTASIVLDGETIGVVWTERPHPPSALDQVLLDRLAIAAAAVVERYGPASTTMADPALVELAISAGTDDAARARALRLLGFPAWTPARVVAVRTTLALNEVGARLCPGGPVRAAALADVGVILASAVDPERIPAGVHAGIGTTDRADRSWRQARTALRFANPRQPVIRFEDLGSLALLADIPPDVARANPDVTAVADLAQRPDDLRTLEAYCTTGSVRQAAAMLHLHHSSVARRLDQIGRCVRINLTEPTGLVRARLALTTWQLLNG